MISSKEDATMLPRTRYASTTCYCTAEQQLILSVTKVDGSHQAIC